jgi:YidC/Oxa1 family membrane protein insertase
MDSLRVFAAIVLAVSVFMLFDAWVKQNRPPEPVVATVDRSVPAAPGVSLPGSAPTQGIAQPPTLAGETAQTVTVTTDLYIAEIDTRGGVLKRLELLEHRDTIDKSKNFDLFEKVGDRTYYAQSGLIGSGLPNHTTIYRSSQSSYSLAEGQDELVVPLAAEGTDGLQVTQRYVFKRGSYVIQVGYDIRNSGTQPVVPHAYFQLMRDGNAPPGDSMMLPTFTGAAIYTDASKFKKISFDDIAKGKTDYPKQADNGWAAIVQHYFVAAWLPEARTPREFYTRAIGDGLYAVGLILPVAEIAPEATASVSADLYAGPQEQDNLSRLAPGLDLTVDYGWLTIIAAPLFWVLQWIHKWVDNWGVAIILLTVLIKLIFYPLSAASYRSMAKMRVVAPKLQKLKELYGDDRQRMQQGMLELYKTEKINPLGGCLPILVQIPVFIALYWVLLASVELRHAPFMLWIQDLSAKDPYYVLPVLMGLSIIVQTRLNPTPPDPVQAKVMKIMPVVFSVFFFFFPAGLVLYWLVNNLLSIAQQWQITRAIEGSKPANATR